MEYIANCTLHHKGGVAGPDEPVEIADKAEAARLLKAGAIKAPVAKAAPAAKAGARGGDTTNGAGEGE